MPRPLMSPLSQLPWHRLCSWARSTGRASGDFTAVWGAEGVRTVGDPGPEWGPLARANLSLTAPRSTPKGPGSPAPATPEVDGGG